jgi:hypothetical protein
MAAVLFGKAVIIICKEIEVAHLPGNLAELGIHLTQVTPTYGGAHLTQEKTGVA